jgi:cell division initiation protein
VALTPVEIRHLRFGRRLLGYRRRAVDDALDEIVDSFEDVWRDRADLADRVEELEGSLVRYRELETLLRQTLVSAERAAHELKSRAAQEAELIVEEARAEARAVVRAATAERERLLAETNRTRALLRAALETLDDGDAGADGGAPAQAA